MRYARADLKPLTATTKALVLKKQRQLDLSVKELAHAIGISRETYYRAMQHPMKPGARVSAEVRDAFRDWLVGTVKRRRPDAGVHA